jgi:hypothetical protein
MTRPESKENELALWKRLGLFLFFIALMALSFAALIAIWRDIL